jgi:hypothetical protein
VAQSLRSQPKSYVGVIEGEPEHDPLGFVDRLRNETLAQIFSDAPGDRSLMMLDWPLRASASEEPFRDLLSELENHLGAGEISGAAREAGAKSVVDALNSGVGPRTFFCLIPESTFTKAHARRLDDWVEFWSELTGARLNYPAGLFLCFQYDGAPDKPGALASIFRRSGGEPEDLGAYVERAFGTAPRDAASGVRAPRAQIVRLPALEAVNREHLRIWSERLERISTMRWLAKHAREVMREFADQALISIGEVRKAINRI